MRRLRLFNLPIFLSLVLLLVVSVYLLGAERLRVLPSRSVIGQGDGMSFRLTVTGDFNPDRTIEDLFVEGLPPGATATFKPEVLPIPGTGTLLISTGKKTPPGSYQLIIIGTPYQGGRALDHVIDRVRLEIRGPVSPKTPGPSPNDATNPIVIKERKPKQRLF